ncbi:LysE family translocator [Modicisalibacter coralii]|uniref:LysE family translocator n=1 Tax=Modicisalibacter coralii TaxID=2304602 RepID=UPI00100BC024|nr:LysE family translocator [Halomonas coralii]
MTSLLTLTPVFGLLFASLITPGPNNFIVLFAAKKHGLGFVAKPISGIILGGVTVIILTLLGLDKIVHAYPVVRKVMVIVGGGYLLYMGYLMFRETGSTSDVYNSYGFFSLALFQIINVKTWVMAVTVSSSAITVLNIWQAVVVVSAMLVALGYVCLYFWASFGRLVDHLLNSEKSRKTVNQMLGGVLMVSSAWLVVSEII